MKCDIKLVYVTGECVQTGDQEQCGGGHSGASQEENGAGSSGHPENGHHGPDRAQQGHSFQVSLTAALSASLLHCLPHCCIVLQL